MAVLGNSKEIPQIPPQKFLLLHVSHMLRSSCQTSNILLNILTFYIIFSSIIYLNLSFVRFSSAAVYYGVSLGVSDLSGEMYRDFILAMLIEIPALILSIFLMNR